MLAITASTAVSAMGLGAAATHAALRERRSGLRPNDFDTAGGWIGRVAAIDTHRLPSMLAEYDCRNNRLADIALRTDGFDGAVRAAIARHGADRIAIVLGTSTSGVLSAEEAYAHRGADGLLPAAFDYDRTHDMFSATHYVRDALGLRGPALVVSTACASSAKSFMEAHHLIAAGFCDAAVVGGVDTLCRMTLRGFAALDLISPTPCRPCDAARAGISIGEAAGFALLERGDGPIHLLGYGVSSDGYHMSSPHPQGAGAIAAMQAALAKAKLPAGAIDYVNLHGTGTRANDAMEDGAVAARPRAGPAIRSAHAASWRRSLPGSAWRMASSPAASAWRRLTRRSAPGC
jgi:3-oxoacyl-[acyl-carrier-protein] synthase I